MKLDTESGAEAPALVRFVLSTAGGKVAKRLGCGGLTPL